MFISSGLTPPYYATIFPSVRDMTNTDYDEMAEQIEHLVKQQEGFLGIESVRSADGNGVTVCYWKTLEDLKRWKTVELHKLAQQLGKQGWYSEYAVRIVEVLESYEKV